MALKPKHHELVERVKKERKLKHKNDYRPSEAHPTVDEAKSLLTEYYAKRDVPVETIRNKGDSFLVIFGESEILWPGTDKYRGLGPYGMYSVEHSWDAVKQLKEKQNARNKIQAQSSSGRSGKQAVRGRPKKRPS